MVMELEYTGTGEGGENLSTIKQQALEKLGAYMDSATRPERKEMLMFLEGFTYAAENIKTGKGKKEKSA